MRKLKNKMFPCSRMPVPYQYSALRQFDNDPDDDVIDPENSLNMMVDDSTSDDEEIVGRTGNGSAGPTTSSKTIGAIDLDNPPDANAVRFNPVYSSLVESRPVN